MSSNNNNKNKKPTQSGCCGISYMLMLRVTGGICGVLVFVLGIILLATTHSSDPKIYVNGLYQIIFGLLIVVAEIRVAVILHWFSFLTSYVGLGLSYIFVGGLALGNNWYEIVLAIVMCTLALVYIFYGCCYQGSTDPNNNKNKNQGNNNNNNDNNNV